MNRGVPSGYRFRTLGQLTSTWFAYAILRKRITRWSTVIAVLPTIFMTMAVNIYLDILNIFLALLSSDD